MSEADIVAAIRSAIRSGDTAKVLELIGQKNGRIDVMTPFGTWLHIASKAGRLELVQALVQMGADVNRKGGTFGGSALNLAAGYGQVEIAEFLIDHGANLHVAEPEQNPLFSAIQGGHLAIVKLLIEKGIDHTIAYTGDSMKGMAAIDFAIERGQTEIATFLSCL